MKKVAIVFVLVCSFLIAPLAQAQVVSDPEASKLELISLIKQLIVQLEQELQNQINNPPVGNQSIPMNPQVSSSISNIQTYGNINVTGVNPKTISLNQISEGQSYVAPQLTVYGSGFDATRQLVYTTYAGFQLPSIINKKYVKGVPEAPYIKPDSSAPNGTSITFTIPSSVTPDAVADSEGNVTYSLTFWVQSPQAVAQFTVPVVNE